MTALQSIGLVVAVIGLLALVALAWINALDRADAARIENGAQPLPTARRLRSWYRDRYDLNPALRRGSR